MAVDLYVQDDNNFILDVPTNDLDLLVGQPVVTRIENDYEELNNKPSINNVELIGDKSFEDLGLVDATTESSGLMSAEDKAALDAIPSELEDIQESIPTKTSELENDSGFITDAGVTSFNGQTGDITYSAPVTSVNGQTGDVTGLQEQLTFDDQPTQDSNNPVTSGGIYDAIEYAKQDVRQDIADVRADIPTKTSELENDGYDGTSTYVEADQLATVATSGAYTDLTGQPTDLSDFNNDSGFVNATEAANAAPVQSVNGQTGTVTLDASDVGALPDTTSIPTKTSELINDGADGTSTYVETDDLPEVHNIPSGGNAGQVLKKNSATNYDVHWANETEIYTSGYCTTAGGTATKVVNCSLWTATPNTYLHILMAQANSYAGAITMKINASSPIPVYINGTASSSTNYSLPAGSYLAFYDGTNIHLRTDGQLPANIVGEAAGTEAKLAPVATSGQYSDLSGQPTDLSDFNNDVGFLTLGTLPIWNGGVV